MEERAVGMCNGGKLAHRLDAAELGVRSLNGHEHRVGVDRFLKRVCGDKASGVGAQARHAKALLLEALCGHEHRLVLDVRHDDVRRERARGHATRLGSGGGDAQKHRVVGLGGT